MSKVVRRLGISAVLALLATAPVSAAVLPVQATLDLAFAGFGSGQFVGAPGSASSDGVGGAATLPPGILSGTHEFTFPPLLAFVSGIRISASGWTPAPASNLALSWNGTTGTMGMNASAYLMTGSFTGAEIPLGVFGVGGTAMGVISTLLAITVQGNPYQLGVVTLMGGLNGQTHTVTATGYDARTPNGAGTLVLVSPLVISVEAWNGTPLGSLAGIATLTLELPEPGGLALLGLGVLALIGFAARRR